MVYQQAMPLRAKQQQRTVLGPVLGLVALGVCGLIFLGVIASAIGVAGVVVGVLCSLLPVVPVVAAFLWADRWEPEPPRLLLTAFMWGACFATLVSLVINTGASIAADSVYGRGYGDVVSAAVVAPLVEEAVKAAFLIGLLLWRRREFDGVIDGIVYAGLVAAGFAFMENVLYIGSAFTADVEAGESGGVLLVLFLRGVLSPFAHPLFTVMTGIGVGVAAISRSKALRVIAPLAGYLLAVLLHALWNGSATLYPDGSVFFAVYFLIMVPLFGGMIWFVIYQRRREQQVVAAALPGFAHAGWIAPSEIELLSSLAGRRGWRSAVQRRSGPAAAKAVGDYQAAVTELAFLRNRLARAPVEVVERAWHDELLTMLGQARRRAMGMPGALAAAWRQPPPGWRPPPPPPPNWVPPPPPASYAPPAPPPQVPVWARPTVKLLRPQAPATTGQQPAVPQQPRLPGGPPPAPPGGPRPYGR